jgi:hypothetical protein
MEPYSNETQKAAVDSRKKEEREAKKNTTTEKRETRPAPWGKEWFPETWQAFTFTFAVTLRYLTLPYATLRLHLLLVLLIPSLISTMLVIHKKPRLHGATDTNVNRRYPIGMQAVITTSVGNRS